MLAGSFSCLAVSASGVFHKKEVPVKKESNRIKNKRIRFIQLYLLHRFFAVVQTAQGRNVGKHGYEGQRNGKYGDRFKRFKMRAGKITFVIAADIGSNN